MARDVPSLQAEVARLETLLSEAGIGSNESSTTEALRKENARLRKALVAPEARAGSVWITSSSSTNAISNGFSVIISPVTTNGACTDP